MSETGLLSRRWLWPAALALFLGGPCLLLALAAGNTVRWMQAAEAATERGAQLARLEARVRGLAQSPAAAPVETASLFLSTGSPSLARAELQTRLADLVAKAGGRLVEVQIEDEPQPADPLSLLARLTLESRNPGLVDLLEALEGARPLLTIEGLTMRPAQARGTTAEDDPLLRVGLAVRGYRPEERP
ncbi:type II secretion system protein GspM [Methylobacterium sp. ID0610]|uniref:type II secretion system protein GspM n=1 Tax=Methylobacterium carpenticola TaxID=3344827 RepID=UPI0036870727